MLFRHKIIRFRQTRFKLPLKAVFNGKKEKLPRAFDRLNPVGRPRPGLFPAQFPVLLLDRHFPEPFKDIITAGFGLDLFRDLQELDESLKAIDLVVMRPEREPLQLKFKLTHALHVKD
jgi:hypothetical protein